MMDKSALGKDCPSTGDMAYFGCALTGSDGLALCSCGKWLHSCYQPSLLTAVNSDEDMKAFLAGRCSLALWVHYVLFAVCGLFFGLCIGASCAHSDEAVKKRAKSALKRRSTFVQ